MQWLLSIGQGILAFLVFGTTGKMRWTMILIWSAVLCAVIFALGQILDADIYLPWLTIPVTVILVILLILAAS